MSCTVFPSCVVTVTVEKGEETWVKAPWSADSKAGRGKLQEEPRVSCGARKRGSVFEEKNGPCQKGTRVNPKDLPMANLGQSEQHNK